MCWTFLQEYWTKNIDSFKEDFHERGSFRAHRSWRDGHGARKNAAFLRARRPSVRCRHHQRSAQSRAARAPRRVGCARFRHSCGDVRQRADRRGVDCHAAQAARSAGCGGVPRRRARFARKADGRFHTGGPSAKRGSGQEWQGIRRHVQSAHQPRLSENEAVD